MYRIGVDLGGTNIAVGVVDENYKIIGRGKVKTNAPRPAEEIFDDIAKAINMAVEDAGLTMDDISFVGGAGTDYYTFHVNGDNYYVKLILIAPNGDIVKEVDSDMIN